MTTRKPDWAQRMVEPYEWHEGIDGGVFATHIRADNAATLLRAHHRRVKRMVSKLREVNGPNLRYDAVYKSACDDILAALKEMER